MQTTNISFSDCSRHLYVQKLNTVNKQLDCGMRSWLFGSNHYVVTNSADNYVEVCYYDEKEVLAAWASDISRLSCAFLESVANIKVSDITNKFLAWNMVQYYYSAFYSAHSILKILGFGLIQLDGMIIEKLNRNAIAMGVSLSNEIKRGIYCIKFGVNNSLAFYKIGRYDDSHKGLWNRFYEVLCVLNGEYVITNSYGNDCLRLKEANEGVPMSLFGKVENSDALDAQNRIDQLKSVINMKGDRNWLSYIRNYVNYNHGLGVWYPYTDGSSNYDRVATMKDLCFQNFLDNQFDIGSADDEVIKFVKICQLVNAMNYDLLTDLKKRNPNTKSFLNDFVFKYVNLLHS